jgi:16S rRNA (adenine1518-N6/adenine1519-N6)-dimethyltransferase
VRLDLRSEPLLDSTEAVRVFENLVRRAFSQRRKMIPKLLRQDWPAERLQEAFAQAGVDPKWRAEDVTLDQYVAMAQVLSGARAE